MKKKVLLIVAAISVMTGFLPLQPIHIQIGMTLLITTMVITVTAMAITVTMAMATTTAIAMARTWVTMTIRDNRLF